MLCWTVLDVDSEKLAQHITHIIVTFNLL